MKLFVKLRKKLFGSIKTKMLSTFLVTSFLTSMTAIFILIVLNQLTANMNDMFSDNIEIKEFLTTMQEVDSNLTKYLVTDDSDSVLNYFKAKDLLLEQATNMYDETLGIYSEDALIYKDIFHMVESYIEETDAAVKGRQLDDADEYIERYGEADKIAIYIKSFADKVNLSHLDENTQQYSGMSKDLNKLLITNIILIASVISINVILILYLTYNITKPVIKLAQSAEEIAKGNFETEDVEVFSDDEISIMGNAFNAMKHSIKDYIYELHDKSETESKLMEQQIENLKMQYLLDDAELKALQAQINPHFLFNTLNAGMQLAMMEDANKTSEFLDDLAKIFRYNVRNVDRVVRIKDEIEMITSYANLFKVRFGNHIEFYYDIDESLLEYNVPPLIIQPLLENATIHGIGDKEEGGSITTTIKKHGDRINISVHDDGVGIDEETRKLILQCSEFEDTNSWHTTGIGISNVIQRLNLFFSIDNVIDIESAAEKGTTVTLKIPMEIEKDRTNREVDNV